MKKIILVCGVGFLSVNPAWVGRYSSFAGVSEHHETIGAMEGRINQKRPHIGGVLPNAREITAESWLQPGATTGNPYGGMPGCERIVSN